MASIGGTTSTINLSDSWGSALVGLFVALVFYGISILQVFIYYERYSKDSIILKSLVACVFVLDTLHTVLICVGVWQYFVVHFGDDKFLTYVSVPVLLSIVVTSAVSTTVQSFFIYLIWSLMRSRLRWLFPAIIMPFVVAKLVLSVFYVIVEVAFHANLSALYGLLLTKLSDAVNGIAAAVDITITVCLCTLLVMGRTGSAATDWMLLRLIFVAVNTGLSSALFVFLSVILKAIYPTNLIYAAVYTPLCAVYCNTLLANLNACSFVRGGSEIQHDTLSSLVYRHTFITADADAGLEQKKITGIESLPTINV